MHTLETREAAVDELKQLYKVLFDDVVAAGIASEGSPSEFATRTFVRSFFAYVEGVLYGLRRVAATSLEGTDILTEKHADKLKEQKRIVQDNGDVQLVEKFYPLADSLRFVLRCYGASYGLRYESSSGIEWESMLAAIKIRDRLMHPKSVASLAVTPEEITSIYQARTWWSESVRELLTACDEEDARLRTAYAEQGEVGK